MIITTSSNDQNPVITISGNIEDEDTPCPYATLTIGCKSNVHYQSLLPIEAFHLKDLSNSSQRQQEDQNDQQPGSFMHQHDEKLKPVFKSEGDKKIFKYQIENQEILFPIVSEGLMKCYNCQKPFKLIVQHLKKSQECNNNINIDDLKSKLALFKNTTPAQRKAKSATIQKEKNPAGFNAAAAARKARSRKIQKEKDPAGFNAAAAKQVAKSAQIQKEKDPAGFNATAAARKAKSTQIQKEKDPAGFNAAAAKEVAKSTQIQKEKDPAGFNAAAAERKAKS